MRPLKSVHARPLRRVALCVAVVALAHPQEVGGEARAPRRCRCAWPRSSSRLSSLDQRADGDRVAGSGCGGARSFSSITSPMYLQDLVGGGDRRAGPRLEAVAEGVEVAVGADAGIAVRAPGAAEALLRLEHDEARAGALLASGGRRRRRRRCRRRRSGRRSARWSWRTTARARWRYRAWACLSWRMSGELPSNIKGNALRDQPASPKSIGGP